MLQKNYIQKQMRTKYKYQKKDIYIYVFRKMTTNY